MKTSAACVLLFLSFVAVHGTSDSDIDAIYNCDATSPLWGCSPDSWTNDDRLRCTETGQLMNWATKTVRSDCYRLTAGPEDAPLTQYVPDEYVDIHVRVTCHKKLFRGILMYAVNEANVHVGDWYFPYEQPAWFENPWQSAPEHPCARSVMHSSAALKPYHNLLHFKAPPAGTGKITFRCLIKYGNANTGDFYWPNAEGDLELNEGPSSPVDETTWLKSEVGQSCDEFCSSQGSGCDSDALHTVTSEEALRAQVGTTTVCKPPFLSGCGDDGATMEPLYEHCYYEDLTCAEQNRAPSTLSCSSKTPGALRLCPCNPAFSAAPSIRGGLGFLSALLVAPFLLANGRASIVLIAALAVMVQGHNWVNSNSRSMGANAYAPCNPPLTQVPKAQVGPNQAFQVEWMNGHGGYTFFAILKETDSEKMLLHTEKLLNDYIAKAPPGSNTALTPEGQKYHRKETPTLDNDYVNNPIPDFFKEVIAPTDPEWIYRPASFRGRIGAISTPDDSDTTYQMAYKETELADDVRVSYQSAEYPWLEAVYKFKIVTKHPTRPDTTNFYIPGFHGPGRYIVQYLWKGYRDCIDIDYKPSQVESVYGYTSNETLWTRIDHCLYEQPRNIYEHSEMVTDPQYCLERCAARGTNCGGVNVVPLMAPSSAYKFQNDGTWAFPEKYGTDIYVPWTYGALNASRDAYQSIAAPDMYMCYAVRPALFTDTTDEFTVSSDPEDPIFYSTCYAKLNGNMFQDYASGFTPESLDVSWRYNDRCIDCESQAINSFPNAVPKWTVTDTCVNCDKEPAQVTPPTFPAPPLVEAGVRCDGYANQFQRAAHHSCDNSTVCSKQLLAVGRPAYRGMTIQECSGLVEQDPMCSNRFMMRGTRCECYTNVPCCSTCSRRVDAGADVYEVVSTPDPTCATGTLSEDGQSCCSAECGEGNCIDNAGAVNERGFCCSTCITRPCSQYGPPCAV